MKDEGAMEWVAIGGTEFAQLKCASVAAGEADDLPSEILLVPWGTVESKNGTFILDDAAAKLILEAFAEHGVDVAIDYEHQSLGGEYGAPDGKAPAAGWISKLSYVPECGLYGVVAWTPKAAAMIRDQEYRYLSPVAIVRKEDMRMVALDSAALTNRPAIPRMEPLEAHCWWLRKGKKRKEKHSMDAETTTGTSDPTVALARIAEILEIEDTADIGGLTQAILEAVRKLKGGGEKKEGEGGEPVASKRVLELLGLKADADENATFVAVNALRANGEKMTALLQRVEAAERKIADRDAEDLIRPFIQDGRINPNNVEWVASCREMARTNPEQFKLVMANTVPNPPPGRTTAPPRDQRTTVIANAQREYLNDPGARVTNLHAYVNLSLREQGLPKLTQEEAKGLAA